MSSFVQSAEHISTLVWAGLREEALDQVPIWWRVNYPGNPSEASGLFQMDRDWWRQLTPQSANTVGQMLTDANVAAVNHRYQVDELLGYTYRLPRVLHPPAAILKAIAGYEYQTSELDGWPETEAAQFCEALRKAVARRVPGYEEADTWAI